MVGAVTRRIEKMTSRFVVHWRDQLPAGRRLDRDADLTARSRRSSPTTLWDAPTSDPITDLTNAANTIIANSGLVPDTVVMGADALSRIPEQPRSQEQLNKLHFVAGGISPTAPTRGRHGAVHRHALSGHTCRIFGYAETYEDEATNALKPMIAAKHVLLGCSKSPATDLATEAVTQVEQDGETRTLLGPEICSAKARDSRKKTASSCGSPAGRA